MMNPAALTSLIFGVSLLGLYAWIALKPESAVSALRAYPRTVWPGRLLTVICMIWFARNLWMVDLGGFNELKKILYVAVPIGIYLIIVFIPDLLSVRGVCVFIVLGARPLLVETRWTGTPASFAVALFVYLLLIKSMFLVVYPHLWIRSVDWWKEHPEYRIPSIAVGGLAGAALTVCGLLSL